MPRALTMLLVVASLSAHASEVFPTFDAYLAQTLGQQGPPRDFKAADHSYGSATITFGIAYNQRVWPRLPGVFQVIILLAGSDKGTQTKDIKAALRLA